MIVLRGDFSDGRNGSLIDTVIIHNVHRNEMCIQDSYDLEDRSYD